MSLRSGTIPLNDRHLANDAWFSMLQFLNALDLISFSQCSRISRAAAVLPGVVKPLLRSHPDTPDFWRSALALAFLSRRSKHLLVAFVSALKRLQPLPHLPHTTTPFAVHVFDCFQIAGIADFFPNHIALYDLATALRIPALSLLRGSTTSPRWLFKSRRERCSQTRTLLAIDGSD